MRLSPLGVKDNRNQRPLSSDRLFDGMSSFDEKTPSLDTISAIVKFAQ
jgi:hypothetical protein